MRDERQPKIDWASNRDVEIVEPDGIPGAWTVEAIDDRGGIEQTIFLGPKARERAQDYALYRYGPRH